MTENTQDNVAAAMQTGAELENQTEQQIDEALRMLADEVKLQSEEPITQKREGPSVEVSGIIKQYRAKIFKMLDEETEIYLKTDNQFLEFLKNFVSTQNEKEKQKIDFKERFFTIVMFGFLILIVTPFALVLSIKDLSQTTAIVSMVTILIELVSAIIVLPEIIAKYLFNKEEDEQLLNIIESMQKYNQNRHEYISKNIDMKEE